MFLSENCRGQPGVLREVMCRSMRKWFPFAGIGLLLAVGAAWHWLSTPTYAYRYRLTLEVEIDGKLRTGSSVVEVQKFRTGRWNLEPNTVRTRVTGEATVVDLGDGRALVALLERAYDLAMFQGHRGQQWRSDPTSVLADLYGVNLQWNGTRNEGLQDLSRRRGSRELRPNQLPTLMLFEDRTDRRSAILVDVSAPTIGSGPNVRLKRAIIEITDAPVSTGISAKLPWIDTTPGHLSGSRYCRAEDLSPTMPFCPERSQFIRAAP